jgi:hypothetical protein
MKRLLLILAVLLAARSLHAEMRTFKNSKGEEIKAELISAGESRVELKREDGRQFTVALTSLSEADQKWITDWRKKHKHYVVQMQAAVKKGNTREEKGGGFGAKDRKGNDCWYILDFKNTGAEALTGLHVEYIMFAPASTGLPGLCGTCDVAAVPAGKAGQAVTQKLFVDQAQTVLRSGTVNGVQFSENTLAGIRAEIFVMGKPAGAFLSGRVPADAEELLKQWRDKEKEKGKTAKDAAVPPAKQ